MLSGFTLYRQQLIIVHLLILCSVFSVPARAAQEIEVQPQHSDIRVLIDVSGSMKKNDPKNLRLPALRLLVGLLPAETTVAVWNFGSRTELLAALGKANEQWKKGTNTASNKIHAKDLFTNIGLALETAIADWDIPAPNQSSQHAQQQQRSIILLTDGMIDISKDDKKNITERKRILTGLLPEIEKTGASIHTIALSENADHEFLKQLSTKTDGGYEQTDNAEQLERIFLRLFEKTVKPDTLPLINNKFLVDQSILELTLLVFKTKNGSPTIVVEPDKTEYQQDNKPGYVKWQSEKNYDLISITRPKTGEWSIKTQTDPDNRVMVVTNLQIQTARLPNNLFAGETLNVSLYLSDDNKKIRDDNFLQFTSMTAIQKEPHNKRWFLHDNGLRGDEHAHDGIYNVAINKSLSVGINKFTYQAKSETFQREVNHLLLVHDIDLINTRVMQEQKNNKNYHQILATPNLEFVQARGMKLTGLLIEGDLPENEEIENNIKDNKNNLSIELKQLNPKVLEWSYESHSLNPDLNYHIIFHMLTKTRNGRKIDYISKPIQLNIEIFKISPITPDPLLKDETNTIAEKDVAVKESSQQTTDAEKSSDWLIGIIIAVIINILFAVAGWFGFRQWKKSRAEAYENIIVELD